MKGIRPWGVSTPKTFFTPKTHLFGTMHIDQFRNLSVLRPTSKWSLHKNILFAKPLEFETRSASILKKITTETPASKVEYDNSLTKKVPRVSLDSLEPVRQVVTEKTLAEEDEDIDEYEEGDEDADMRDLDMQIGDEMEEAAEIEEWEEWKAYDKELEDELDRLNAEFMTQDTSVERISELRRASYEAGERITKKHLDLFEGKISQMDAQEFLETARRIMVRPEELLEEGDEVDEVDELEHEREQLKGLLFKGEEPPINIFDLKDFETNKKK